MRLYNYCKKIPCLTCSKGYKIQATIFGLDVDIFQERLLPNNVYYISNALVQPIECRFRMVLSPFQWIINKRTFIKLSPDCDKFELIEDTNVIPLNEVHSFIRTYTYIDIVAVVIQIQPRRTVATKEGPTTT